jgi:hypothetical protein
MTFVEFIRIYEEAPTAQEDIKELDPPSVKDFMEIASIDPVIKDAYDKGLSYGLSFEQLLIFVIAYMHEDRKELKGES